MARPPGYATGAHVLAGCLPDRLSAVLELINTPTLPTVFSKHVPGYVYTARCIYATSLMWRLYKLKHSLDSFYSETVKQKGGKLIHCEPKNPFDYCPEEV